MKSALYHAQMAEHWAEIAEGRYRALQAEHSRAIQEHEPPALYMQRLACMAQVAAACATASAEAVRASLLVRKDELPEGANLPPAATS